MMALYRVGHYRWSYRVQAKSLSPTMPNLELDYVFFYPLENAVKHKTDKYEIVQDENEPIPVFRRGAKFSLAVRFLERRFLPESDVVKLIFNYGPEPNSTKGTKAVVSLKNNVHIDENTEENWVASLLRIDEDTLVLECFSPANIPVGRWYLEVETSEINSTEESCLFDDEYFFYFLFNPWSKMDLVYMPEERLLEEYVLNDLGKIWTGPLSSTRGREWVFGQFDAVVLPAVMFMLGSSGLPWASHGDPIKLTRTISKMVNSNDDNGILIGRWDGNYEDGTPPSSWTGTAPILEQYLTNEDTGPGTPVSYGQCWVFAGVVTTICRALGIPSRVVTNLVSAHDANGTLSIDKYFDKSNNEIQYDPNNKSGDMDSIWNYHVWNDVYMARPDLPAGYGGWQAIDATPQETSNGFFQCGPASVQAIKKGHVGLNYDVAFMVASVNADLMKWKEDPKSDFGWSQIYCNKYHIGKHIFTKKPFIFDHNGDRDKEDIVYQYKPKEGTGAERLSLLNAVRGTEGAKRFYQMPHKELEDVEFDLKEIDQIYIGEEFAVHLIIKNKSKEVRTVNATLHAVSVYYTGVLAHEIKKSLGELKIQPLSDKEVKLLVKRDDYLEKLVEYSNIKISAIASIIETNQTWAEEDDFQVMKPSIKIETPSEISEFQPIRINISFKNPIPKTLTNCKFHISSPSLIRNFILAKSDVKPYGYVSTVAEIVAKKVGEATIVATFYSKELSDVTGSAKLEVFPSEG